MRQSRKNNWMKLDNASKIFPATSNNKDTKVFRITCELNEEVDADILQEALDITVNKFPLYKLVLRRGLFWYYFEPSKLRPLVELESKPVCAPIYFRDEHGLLFRTIYFNNRISIEVYHALSDGTGALWFMRTLVYHYLLIKHKEDFQDGSIPELDYNASISSKMDDSYDRYYSGDFLLSNLINKNDNSSEKDKVERPKSEKNKNKRAYRVRGLKNEENRLRIIEGSMPVKSVLDLSRSMGTTLTIFLSSLLIYSIYKEMPTRSRIKPIMLSVPVNLRKYLESYTARNFFTTINVGHYFSNENLDFNEILASVKNGFEQGLDRDSLLKHTNLLVSIENNPIARVIPISIKDYVLRAANHINNTYYSAAISNIGVISLPDEFSPYIKQFGACFSTLKPQLTVCSYNDRLVITFGSPFQKTEIQRIFFKYLSDLGVDIEISTNL